MDTVGWDDADLEDNSTFKEILSFINENELFNVKGSIPSIPCCPSYGFKSNSIFNPRLKFSLPFIMSFDFTNRYCHISAILWTVAPNVRKDALLMKQARLIDLFRFGHFTFLITS